VFVAGKYSLANRRRGVGSRMVVAILLGGLSVLAATYVVVLGRLAVRQRMGLPSAEGVALGAVTNFFDTLGIGSFAPTTAWIRLRRLVPDSYLPAVLNAGHALPTVAEALIFITLVKVDPWLLAACIAAAVLGALIGAPIVVRLPPRAVQGVVGVALLVAAAAFVAKNLQMMPGGGAELSLPPPLFAVAVAGYFVFGALMTCGIGLFAPSLVLLPLLGMSPAASFPMMMGACAFLMPVSSFEFLRSDRIDIRLTIAIALGGVPAVLVAALLVKSLPLTTLRWGVVIVVIYAAAVLLRAALQAPSPAPEPTTA
jgi:uncharacterized membrane protein YfcA